MLMKCAPRICKHAAWCRGCMRFGRVCWPSSQCMACGCGSLSWTCVSPYNPTLPGCAGLSSSRPSCLGVTTVHIPLLRPTSSYSTAGSGDWLAQHAQAACSRHTPDVLVISGVQGPQVRACMATARACPCCCTLFPCWNSPSHDMHAVTCSPCSRLMCCAGAAAGCSKGCCSAGLVPY